MKCAWIILFSLIATTLLAQSRISLQTGWTISRIRAVYDKEQVQPGPYFDQLVKFKPWHTWCIGAEYEYDYKKLRLSVGFTTLSLGAGNTPLFPDYPWVKAYWMIPLLGGYHLKFPNGWGLVFEGGVEGGIQNEGNWNNIPNGLSMWIINAIVGVEGEYKQFRLGIRGHWGLNTFQQLGEISYKHTAITTYLSYTLWDHAKAKQRRLEREQAKRLGR